MFISGIANEECLVLFDGHEGETGENAQFKYFILTRLLF